MSKVDYEYVIIGAGVIGLSIAKSLADKGKKSVLIIDENSKYGKGISSRNSEVIHSGIYYQKSSLKSKHCIRGQKLLYNFLKEHQIFHNKCGKLVIGNKYQKNEILSLYNNAIKNNIKNVRFITSSDINMLEPNIIADYALFVKSTGILSIHQFMNTLHKISDNMDHDYLLKTKVIDLNYKNECYELYLNNPQNKIEKIKCNYVVNSAGLNAIKIYNFLTGNQCPFIEMPIKGSYFKLSKKWQHKFEHLVYPIPDKKYGTLGIHITIDEQGYAKLGPNAENVSGKVNYNVSTKLLDAFFNESRKFIYNIHKKDLSPDFAGIRPKIMKSKKIQSDFYISDESKNGYPGFINLIGVESPGITSSLSIALDVIKWIT
jgi:L-2-hydroxyglutarate oxidase LhgO